VNFVSRRFFRRAGMPDDVLMLASTFAVSGANSLDPPTQARKWFRLQAPVLSLPPCALRGGRIAAKLRLLMLLPV
jgi:hypothetical protein